MESIILLLGIVSLFVSIPCLIVFIIVKCTTSENKNIKQSGHLRTSTRLIRFFSCLILGVMTLASFKANHHSYAVGTFISGVWLYCILTVQGYEERHYAEAARPHIYMALIISFFSIIALCIFLLHLILTKQFYLVLRFGIPVALLLFAYKNKFHSLIKWLKWVFIRSNDISEKNQ